MNDYQLERLNTRSFEQLIQALSLEILGRQVTVFGDGPDGGREAAFRGLLNFPQGNSPWNGHGIVQAKFRQHPFDRAAKNADWALAELKAEFKKLHPKSKGRRKVTGTVQTRVCPDYYLFSTNLSLSPTLQSGGKDRVVAFLESCKKTHGLIDYAVWDGDQIRRMLDAQTAIRTSFLPFILPGDVLAKVIENLQPKQVDFPKIMLKHLQLELLDDQYAKLSQGGYTNADRISLSNVFVDLPISGGTSPRKNSGKGNSTPRSTILESLFAHAARVLRPSYGPAETYNAPEASKTAVAGRFVIVGGPGQGKTTAGLFACQIMRASLLREAGIQYDRDVMQALDNVLTQAQNLPSLSTLRYPMRVDLKKLAEALSLQGNDGTRTLIEFLVKHISRRTGTKISTDDFRNWLRGYPWLLVLDGLDEVPASSNRTLMMDAINDFVRVEAFQEDADLMIVATTRPQGYSDEFDPSNYAHLELLPLRPAEALSYGTRLAEARHLGAATRIHDLVAILEIATRNQATARLMESPLQVTIMLSLVELGGHPPEQRWQLFRQYYDTIFKREKERGTAFSVILRDYESDIHWIHHRSGWLLQQRNAESGKTAARLSHFEFDTLVHQRLIDRGHADDANLAALVRQMRNAATDRLVLLVGNTAEEIGFEIRSLQEFMAAEHVFDGPDDNVRATLRLIASHAYWQNVLLFMAGRIFFEKEPLVDSLIATCDHLNEPLDDAALAHVGSGSRLALAILADDACRRQPANIRRLARIAARLLDKPLWESRALLSQQFTREAAEVLHQELIYRTQQSKLLFGAWSVCLDLARAGISWAEELASKSFPWGHAKLNLFLKHQLDESGDFSDLFWTNLSRNLRMVSPTIIDEIRSKSKFEEIKKNIASEVADAIAFILDQTGQEELEMELKSRDGSTLLNSFAGSFDSSHYLGLNMQGQEFSDADVAWRVLSMGVDFSLRPTLENLSKQIELLLSLESTPEVSSLYPWQFNVCLAARHAGYPITQILESVDSGVFGRPRDWRRWGKREPLVLSKLAQPVDLMVVDDQVRGNAFCGFGWQHRHGSIDEELEFIVELTSVLPNFQSDRPVSEALIHLACFGLNSIAHQIEHKHVTRIEQFIVALRLNNHRTGREIVSAILKAKIDTAEQIRLLKLFGSSWIDNYWYLSLQGSHSELEVAWLAIYESAVADACIQDLLPTLSQVPPLSCMAKVATQVLDEATRGTILQQNGALLIKLASMQWSSDDSEKIADQIIKIAEKERRWLTDWANLIDSGGHQGKHIENLLLALLCRHKEDDQSQLSLLWERLLPKVADRRSAPAILPDPSPTK